MIKKKDIVLLYKCQWRDTEKQTIHTNKKERDTTEENVVI